MVCVCEPDIRWFIPGSLRHSTVELNKYIRERLKNVINGGSWSDLAIDTLKNDLPEYADVQLIKEHLLEEHPFRTCECRYPTRCCGDCKQNCSVRCVQDLLTRLFFATQSEDPMIRSEVLYVLMNPNTKYEDLCRVHNWCLYRRRATTGGWTDAYDYSSTIKVDEKGNPVVDASSGRVVTIPYPASGLCPFCLSQRELKVYRKRGRPPKNRSQT